MTGPAPSSHITRRTLLLAGAGAAATVAIPDIAMAAKKKSDKKRAGSDSHLDRSAWTPFVGETLYVLNPGLAPVAVTLLNVGSFPSSNKSPEYTESTFYLVFRGPPDMPLAADTHLIKLTGLGRVPVWFSHVYQVDGAWEYVAVFANGKARQRPPKKPRTKGSKRQRGNSGKKRSAKKKKNTQKAERPKKAPAEKPAPAEAAPAEPQPKATPEPAVPVG